MSRGRTFRNRVIAFRQRATIARLGIGLVLDKAIDIADELDRVLEAIEGPAQDGEGAESSEAASRTTPAPPPPFDVNGRASPGDSVRAKDWKTP